MTIDPHGDGMQLHCFKCGFHGDVIDAYKVEHRCSTGGAIRALSELFRIDGNTVPYKREVPTLKAKETAPAADYTAYYTRCQERLADPAALEYLQSRGISTETAKKYGIGFDPAADPANAPGATGHEYKPHPCPRIIIPFDKSHYMGRSISPDTPKQYQKMNSKGEAVPPFNLKGTYNTDQEPVFIVEGAFDALAIMEAGGVAVALNSAANWRRIVEALKDKAAGNPLVLCLDSDKAGRKAAEPLYKELKQAGVSVTKANISGDYKDPNEHLTANRAGFLAAVESAKQAAKEAKPEPVQISESGQEITTPQRGEWLTLAAFRGFLQGAGLAVKYNVLTKRLDFTGDLRGVSSGNAANILPIVIADEIRATTGAKGCSTERIREFLAAAAELERYNPVKMYLDGTQWDKIDRFPLLYGALGIESDSKYQNYLKKWLVQCVALGLNNEDKPTGAEGVLVLAGPQGCGKTAFFRNLCPDGLFAEGAALDVSNTGAGKDSLLKALGGWICELGELDSTTRREQPALKAFITSPWDEIRTPYAVAATRSARRTSFAGTVNGDSFLADTTGSRRFWTIPVSDMDLNFIIDLLPEMREQIWAQAFQMYKENPQGFRLTDKEMETLQADNRAFETLLSYEMEIRAELDPDMDFSEWVWRSAADIRHSEAVPKNADSRQIGKAMQRIAADLEKEVPEGEKLSRTVHGLKQYRFPFKNI